MESVVDEMCQQLGLDPLDVRLKNAAEKGTKSCYGPTFNAIGLVATLEAAKAHPHYTAPLGKTRAGACPAASGSTSAANLGVADRQHRWHGSVTEGNPDIGGSRASISLMAAEELGIAYENVRTIVADTDSLGYNEMTDGSRVTFAVGLATIKAARDAIKKMCGRAARMWGIDDDAVDWIDGAAVPAGPNAGKFPPMSMAEIAAIVASDRRADCRAITR